MIFSRNGNRESAEATLAVVAVGWVADTAGLRLATAGVETDHRGSCRLMGICGLLRPISSPLGTLPVARCWSLRQYRRASWRLPTPCEVRL